MPRLVFKKGEAEPTEISGPTILGRSADQAQIAIKDNRLSRAHCRFEPREDGQWAIVDMGSQNGTFLNGRRVKESVVRPGDVVTIGQCDILFEAVGGPTGSDLMGSVASTRIGPSVKVPPAAPPRIVAELALEEENSSSTRTVVAPAALALLKGTLKDKIFPLVKEVFNIGRKPDNDIVLTDDNKASGHHARITRKDVSTWVLEDLKSTNGVTVNGHKVEEAVVLKNGSKINVGLQLFQFTLQGKPPETSGATAPMAAREVAAKLAEKLEESPLIDAGGEDIGSRSEAIDRQALNVDVKGKGPSSLLFAILEVVLALAIVGLVLGGGWMLLQEETGNVEGGGPGGNESAPGGLLQANNSSLDKLDVAGQPEGWSFDPRGGDSLSMTQSAHGGETAVQLTRFNAGNSVSYLFSAPVEVKSAGLRASVFALNSELSSGRTGTALLALFWYKDPRDPAFARTTLVAASGLKDWTELKGAAGAPSGAKWVRVALGITGKSGSVVFDDVRLEEEPGAPKAPATEVVELKNGLRWTIDLSGQISLSDKSLLLLRDGTLSAHSVDGRADPLDVTLVLIAPPAYERGEHGLTVKYRYFDPIVEKPVELRVDLGENGNAASFSAVFNSGGVEKAANHISAVFVATSAFVPTDLIRFEGERVIEYKRELPDEGQRITISKVVCADTGTGNRIEAANGTHPSFVARAGQGGRELFFQGQNGVQLEFALGARREELAVMTGLVASVQPNETQLDRLARALSIFEFFSWNQREIAVAAEACDSVATFFKLRHLELRDGINVPDLRRNEGLYVAAMDECILSSEKLRERQKAWSETVLPMLRNLEALTMSDTTQKAAKLARTAIEDMIQSADDFDVLSKVARKARFWLSVQIEQRESQKLLLSAKDFLQSGLLTQGRIKLRYIVENYPRCTNGITAKTLMVDQAELLLIEAQERAGEKLMAIAASLKKRCKDYLDLVQNHMINTLLNDDEKLWLTSPEPGASEDVRSWTDLESKLAERIRILREKLAK